MGNANFNNVEKWYQVKTHALKKVPDRWELMSTASLPQKGQVWGEFLSTEKNISRSIFGSFQSITNLAESAALLQVTAAYWPGMKLQNFIRIKLIQWDPASFQRLPEFQSLKPENEDTDNKTSLWKLKCIPWAYTVPYNYFVKILLNILPVSPEACNHHSQTLWLNQRGKLADSHFSQVKHLPPPAGRCLSATLCVARPGRHRTDQMPKQADAQPTCPFSCSLPLLRTMCCT